MILHGGRLDLLRDSTSSFGTLLVAGLLVGMANVCEAQQVPIEPASTHVFPAGGRRGTVVAVRIGGEFLAPYTRFSMFGDGVECQPELIEKASGNDEPSPRRAPGRSPINYPREWKAEVRIADGAPLGQKLWRVSSARGGTDGRPFLVGDLPEVIETESNSTAASAERIVLPVTINGRIAGERDLDYFRFAASEGEVVSVDVAAARLGSPLDPTVEIYDLEGRRPAVEEIRVGSDPVLALHVPATGEYRLLVSNLNFHGGPEYVYRITVSTAPFVRFAFPPGGRAGESGVREFYSLSGGRALLPFAPRKGILSRSESRQYLRSWPQTVAFPSGDPVEFSMAPVIATANAVALETTDLATVVETEPNDSIAAATAISWPVIAYGRLSPSSDDDWYAFSAAKDQSITIDCRPFPRGTGSLPLVTLRDGDGQTLAKASTVESFPKPCRIEWRAPADGRYLLHVRDVRQPGVEAPYRLTLRPTRPDFSLSAAADIVNVVQGARGELELRVDRQGGLSCPIDLKVEGLPDGVRVEPDQVPAAQEVVKLAFIAAADTRPGDALLAITASARCADGTNGNETITRVAAAAHLGHDAEGVSLGSPTVDRVHLTVRHKQVFRLFCSEAYQYAHRGTIYPYLMEVERLDGFDGPIKIEVADRQIMDLDGVEVVDSTFPAGTSQLMLPIYLPENMHINVQPHSNIYAQGCVIFHDQWGQRQSMVQVSEMRCMIRPLPTVARLHAVEKSISLRPGGSAACTLRLDRTSNFRGVMRVELVKPAPGIHMNPILIAPDQNNAVATIAIDDGTDVAPKAELKFRGLGELPGGVTIVSEATLAVVPE